MVDWFKNNGNIIISRNIKFKEEDAWDWGAQQDNHDTPPFYEEK